MEQETSLSVIEHDPVALATERAEAAHKMLAVLGRCTHAGDWVKMGNVYYLTANGADRMARVVGLDVQVLDIRPEQHETPEGEIDVTYVAKCQVTLPNGNTVVEIGTRSLSDDFFSHRGKRPLSQVPRGDVMKAASTNARARAIKSALGIGGMPPDIMAQVDSVDTRKVAEVAFDGAKPAGAPDMTNELRAILAPITTNPAEADKIILLLASFVGRDGEIVRAASIGQITGSEKRLAITKKNLQRVVEEHGDSTVIEILAHYDAVLEDTARKRTEAGKAEEAPPE